MIRPWFDKNKAKYFPEIKDWKSAKTLKYVEKIRNTYSIEKISYKEWFFYHPSCFTTLVFGVSVIAILLFGTGAVYFAYKKIYILVLLFGFIVIHQISALAGKYKNKDVLNKMNFYDLWLSEVE